MKPNIVKDLIDWINTNKDFINIYRNIPFVPDGIRFNILLKNDEDSVYQLHFYKEHIYTHYREIYNKIRYKDNPLILDLLNLMVEVADPDPDYDIIINQLISNIVLRLL